MGQLQEPQNVIINIILDIIPAKTLLKSAIDIFRDPRYYSTGLLSEKPAGNRRINVFSLRKHELEPIKRLYIYVFTIRTIQTIKAGITIQIGTISEYISTCFYLNCLLPTTAVQSQITLVILRILNLLDWYWNLRDNGENIRRLNGCRRILIICRMESWNGKSWKIQIIEFIYLILYNIINKERKQQSTQVKKKNIILKDRRSVNITNVLLNRRLQ